MCAKVTVDSSHKLYSVYTEMKQRCYNKKNKHYDSYGGRGIFICKEWLDAYVNFFNWSIDNGYQVGLTLDRKDNNKGYSPDNCRFVNHYVSMRNRRSCKLISYNGETKTLTEWAAILDVKRSILYNRLYVKNLTPEIAFDKSYTKSKKWDRDMALNRGISIKNIIRNNGRKNSWVVMKMNDAGFSLKEHDFSNKIYGIRDYFNNEEANFIFSLFNEK